MSPQDGSNTIHDAIADSYGYDVGASEASRLEHELVLRHVDGAADVLDVGCANGLYLRVVAPHCRAITGVDINKRMLELARELLVADRIANAAIIEASASALPLDDASFDVVYCFSTLLLVPDVDEALNEVARVLRPDGVALLDITGRYNLSAWHWRRWYRSQGHFGLHAFSFPAIRSALEDRGLVLAEVHALGFLHQWRYLPLVGRLTFLDRLIHPSGRRDRDRRVSNLPGVFRLANRWYVVCRKVGAG